MAIHVKTTFALALLALAPGLSRAAEVARYTTRLTVDPGGAGHAETTLVVTGDPSETAVIPLSHGAWTNFRRRSPTASVWSRRRRRRRRSA
jgi:hypothetical protein